MKNCPHCGKEIENPEQTSPEGLLFHIKMRVHQTKLAIRRRKNIEHEEYKGAAESRSRSLKKWDAWAIWVEKQIINNQSRRAGNK